MINTHFKIKFSEHEPISVPASLWQCSSFGKIFQEEADAAIIEVRFYKAMTKTLNLKPEFDYIFSAIGYIDKKIMHQIEIPFRKTDSINLVTGIAMQSISRAKLRYVFKRWPQKVKPHLSWHMVRKLTKQQKGGGKR